jgi:hypothetical protein
LAQVLLLSEHDDRYPYNFEFRRISMKLNTILVVPALLGALLLSACGEKAKEATEAATEAATTTMDSAKDAATETADVAKDAAAAVAPAAAGGGYEPTAEERVPGITRTKEEQDKINAAAMAGVPMPVIPGEAAPETGS